MKKMKKKDRKKLSPPLDVYWIWHVHMLNPTGYANDMQMIVGDPCDHHEFSSNRTEETQAKTKTKQKWAMHFR